MTGMTKEEFERQWNEVVTRTRNIEFEGGILNASEYSVSGKLVSVFFHDSYSGVLLLDVILKVS